MVLVTDSSIHSINCESQYSYFGCFKGFLLHSGVGNIVVRSRMTICAMVKLSEAISITTLSWFLHGTTLNCLSAISFTVFSATDMAGSLALMVYGLFFVCRSRQAAAWIVRHLIKTLHLLCTELSTFPAFIWNWQLLEPGFSWRNTVHIHVHVYMYECTYVHCIIPVPIKFIRKKLRKRVIPIKQIESKHIIV